jgi:Protein of unknown function (DUF1569)
MKSLRNPEQKKELLLRLQRVGPSSERLWGSMSSHQMICHLSDGYRLYMGEIKAPLHPIPIPRWILRSITLWAPMPWPRGKIPTLRELDQKAGSGTKPQEFAKDVQTLREMLDRFTQLPDNYDWKPHPGLGTLSYSQWMRLGYLHADHHFRQFGA